MSSTINLENDKLENLCSNVSGSRIARLHCIIRGIICGTVPSTIISTNTILSYPYKNTG